METIARPATKPAGGPAELMPGRAVEAATLDWAASFAALSERQFFRRAALSGRAAEGDAGVSLHLSSLGIGTYLGEATDAADAAYAAALEGALAGGINVVDTAINYRHQRSERVIGRVLATGRFRREALLICSKAGFFPFDGEMPADPQRYISETYVARGLARPGQIAGGAHCMAPVYLADQLRRSRENLGLETIDVYYLHNPETQAAELAREEFYRRLRAAFEFLERAAANGEIQFYGAATWSGFRVAPDQAGYLDLARMVATAREVAGEGHRFRFAQLPFNLAMPEAAVLMNQAVERPPYVSFLGAAARLGVRVVGSASLGASRLASLPEEAREHLRSFLGGAETSAEMALQFARASVGTALVGMGNAAHAAENLRVAALTPPNATQISRLLRQ